MATKKPPALDIFRVIKHVDVKDIDFYRSLTDEERKAFAPVVISRWLSGTSNPQHVILLNEFVNPFIFVNHIQRNHKELIWLLYTITGSGKSARREWIAAPKREYNRPVSTKIVAQYYGYNLSHGSDALSCLTGNDVLDIAEDMGVQPDVIKEIRKEWKGEDLRPEVYSSKGKKTKAKDVSSADQQFLEF